MEDARQCPTEGRFEGTHIRAGETVNRDKGVRRSHAIINGASEHMLVIVNGKTAAQPQGSVAAQ